MTSFQGIMLFGINKPTIDTHFIIRYILFNNLINATCPSKALISTNLPAPPKQWLPPFGISFRIHGISRSIIFLFPPLLYLPFPWGSWYWSFLNDFLLCRYVIDVLGFHDCPSRDKHQHVLLIFYRYYSNLPNHFPIFLKFLSIDDFLPFPDFGTFFPTRRVNSLILFVSLATSNFQADFPCPLRTSPFFPDSTPALSNSSYSRIVNDGRTPTSLSILIPMYLIYRRNLNISAIWYFRIFGPS